MAERKKVTDPELLERLDAKPARKKVSDPAVLQRLDAAPSLEAAEGIRRRQVLNSIPLVGPAAAAAMDIIPAPVRDTFVREAGEAATGIAQSIGDAVALPTDVMTNADGINDLYVDPETGRVQSSDALIERSTNAAGVMAPGSRVPVGKRPALPPAAREADEFGIPLTRGQRTGDLRQITKEEGLRQQDGPAQNIVRKFDEQQSEAITAATDDVGRKMGGDAANMPELVTAKVKDKVTFSKDRAGSLYDIAFDGGLVVRQEALDELPGFVRRRLDDDAVIVDAQITPSATRALQEIEAAGIARGALDPEAPRTGAVPRVGEDGVEEVVVSLKGLEQVRKRLVGLKGTTLEDVRAVTAVKKAFDDWLDDGVDNLLITGDDAALQALKEARSEVGVYKSITSPKPGDSVGKSVANLLREETTAEEVANWLYGADVVSPSLNAPKVASRVRNIVGANSPEWAAVRTAAWNRLVKDMGSGEVRTPTMLVKRIERFLNDKGTSLSRILYSPAERQQMQELVRTLKRTVTPRDATNPSRSAHTIAGAVNGIMRMLAGAVGLSTGGAGWGVAAVLAYPVGKNALRTGAAKKAVRQESGTAGNAVSPATKAAPSLLLREKLLETPPKQGSQTVAPVRIEM